MLNPCRNELCYSSRRLLTNHSFRMCARVHVKGSADHSGLSTVFVKYQKKTKKKTRDDTRVTRVVVLVKGPRAGDVAHHVPGCTSPTNNEENAWKTWEETAGSNKSCCIRPLSVVKCVCDAFDLVTDEASAGHGRQWCWYSAAWSEVAWGACQSSIPVLSAASRCNQPASLSWIHKNNQAQKKQGWYKRERKRKSYRALLFLLKVLLFVRDFHVMCINHCKLFMHIILKRPGCFLPQVCNAQTNFAAATLSRFTL